MLLLQPGTNNNDNNKKNLKDFLFPKRFMSNLQTKNLGTEFGIGVVAWARG